MSIKLFVSDVDGTLTDGCVYYSNNGDISKKFSTRDGMGFLLLRKRGIKTCWLSSSGEKMIYDRASFLQIDFILLGIENKKDALKGICQKEGILLSEVAYIGDDINDIECINICGWTFSPSDAHESVLKIVDTVCDVGGGNGAVRQSIDYILKRNECE